LIPICSAQATRHLRSPWYSSTRFPRVFRAWVTGRVGV